MMVTCCLLMRMVGITGAMIPKTMPSTNRTIALVSSDEFRAVGSIGRAAGVAELEGCRNCMAAVQIDQKVSQLLAPTVIKEQMAKEPMCSQYLVAQAAAGSFALSFW